MAGFNALTIADALALCYASLTPPTGLGAIRQSTARLPNNIPTTPWVLVVLPQGEIVIDSTQTATLNFHVIFHFGKNAGDTARDMTAMLSWLEVLLKATFNSSSLGLSATQPVKSALPTGFRLTVETYGGDEYYGWDISVDVLLRNIGWTITP